MALDIVGHVINDQTKRGVAGLRVEAWTADPSLEEPVESADTEGGGAFRMNIQDGRLGEPFGDSPFEFYFKVFRDDELIASTEDSVVWRLDDPSAEIVIEVDLSPEEEPTDGIPREFVGRLLNLESGVPLVGFTVRAFDLDAGAEPEDLGYDITNEDGMFAIAYTVPAKGEAGRRLLLRILDLRANQIHETEILVGAKQERVEEIRVPVSAAPEPQSPALTELADTVALQLPPELLSQLQERNIRTLADVRRAGGIDGIEGVTMEPNAPIVRRLGAHADLSRISPDLELNDALVRRGYASVSAIASAPRTDFVAAARERLGDFKAAQMHVVAQAQASVLQNVTTEIQANVANGQISNAAKWHGQMPNSEKWWETGTLQLIVPNSCGCPDCKAAVSPLAYLADLLNYSLKHLKKICTVNGLKGYYYDNVDLTNLKVTRTDEEVNFPWELESPDPKIESDTFSVRWTGQVLPEHSETYTFHTISDDGVRLWVDGKLIIDNWTDHGQIEDMGTIALQAGQKYDIKLEYYENGGGATIKLLWSSPSLPNKQILPKERLSSQVYEPIDLTFLHNAFRQCFADLPASCKALDDEVRQVRLCIEVLRSYLKTIWAIRPKIMKDALAKDEASYLSAAYQALLTGIGTSYDEVRRARTADKDEKEALAARLGIDLGSPSPDNLDALFLEPAEMREPKLEERFGLVDTTRDPLQPGQKSDLETWRLDHLRTQWLKEDWPTDPYADDLLPADDRLPVIDPDVIGPDDFRNPIAKADPSDPDKPFDIWLKRRKWMDGRIEALTKLKKAYETPDIGAMVEDMGNPVNYGTTTITPWANTSPADFDSLLDDLTQGTNAESAREKIGDLALTVDSFTRLMTLWTKDRQANSDVRNAKVTAEEWREVYSILAQAQKVNFYFAWREEEQDAQDFHFDLEEFWISQREPVQGDWPPAHLIQKPLIDPEVLAPEELPDVIADKVTQGLWQARRARLDQIHTALKEKREAGGANAFNNMVRLALGHPNPGGKLPHKLATLKTKLASEGQAAEDAKKKITQDLYMTVDSFERLMGIKAKSQPTATEWNGVYTILTTAQKVKWEYPKWMEEEEQFPLIDPEVLKLDDLPEPIVGERAIDLWKERKKELEDDYKKLKEKREQSGFDAMLREALGDPNAGDALPHDPAKLSGDLKSGNEKAARAAAIEVTRDLFMTTEDFDRLMLAKAKADQTDPTRKPTALEWAETYATLATAQKQKRRYPDWKTEESAQPTGVVYWMALKARLPRWRTTAEARQVWQQALRTRTGAPIIDPDLIEPQTIKTLAGGNLAPGLWKARRKEVDKLDKDLKQTREAAPDSGQWLEDEVLKAIEVPLQELVALQAARRAGHDIRPRLEQLCLSPDAFSYLLRISDALADNQPVLDSEWNDVYSILVQVHKRRHSFAKWRLDEKSNNVTLSPDYFKIPSVDTTTFPPPPPMELPAWRASWRARQARLDTLQGRIDQEQSVIAGLQKTVSDTEEATLPMLRDALLKAIGQRHSTLESNAKWFTDRFQIDARPGGCQKTSRITQAIETLQGILFSVRTRQLNDVYPDLELDADDFDEEWEWIGSYATWRAAMFTFLYPENILLPTLRRWRTPALRKLVQDLRDGPRLTPERACSAARDYSTYLRDVCSLQLEASCEALTRVYADEDCREGSGLGYRNPVYMFARGGVTKKVYWSAYDPNNQTGFAQTFWEGVEVPNLENVTRILGAVPYRTLLEERYIFLFAQTVEQGKQKLVFARYDLENPAWIGDLTELDLPDNVASFTALIAQQIADTRPPQLIIRASDGTIYYGHLNQEGSGWAQKELDKPVPQEKGKDLEILGMVARQWPGYYLFARNTAGSTHTLEFRLYGDKSEPRWRRLGATGSWEWVGVIEIPDSGETRLYAYWTEKDVQSTAGPTRYQEVIPTTELAYQTIATVTEFYNWLRTSSDGTYDLAQVSLENFPLSWPRGSQDPWSRGSRDHISNYFVSFLHLLTLAPDDDKRTELGDAAYRKLGLDAIRLLDQVINPGLHVKVEWSDPGLAQQLKGIEVFLNNYARYLSSSLYDFLRGLFTNAVPASGETQASFEFRDVPSALPSTPAPSLTGLSRVAVGCSESVRADNYRIVAFQRSGNHKGTWLAVFSRGSDGLLASSGPLRMAPLIIGPLDLPQHLSEAELQIRRVEIKAVFETNTGGASANTVYQQEAYYFVPVHLALQLQQRGHYTEALDWFRTVYDYSMPRMPWMSEDQRKIYYGLKLEEAAPLDHQRATDWLLDPLNPHAVAATRRNTYTRFTQLSLVRCLLEYADAEFTRDTAESVPRARTLYLTALELLDQPELQQYLDLCEELIGTLDIQVGDLRLGAEWTEIKEELKTIDSYHALVEVVEKVKNELTVTDGNNRNRRVAKRVANVRTLINEAKEELPKRDTFGEVMAANASFAAKAHAAVLAQPDVSEAVERAGTAAGEDFLHSVSAVSGISSETLNRDSVEVPWLREAVSPTVSVDRMELQRRTAAPISPDGGNGRITVRSNLLAPTNRATQAQIMEANPLLGVRVMQKVKGSYVPGRIYGFCIPPNPVVRALRLRAELNLYKLRSCRNIAGMQRQLEPYAAPTDTTSGMPTIGAGGQLTLPGATTFQPTPYRYPVLIERAKHLANLAQQMEGAFLSALEKLDAERYNLLKARQDMRLAQAGVRLQKLRVTEAEGGVTLAELQVARALEQETTYGEWIDADLNQQELEVINLYRWAAGLQATSAAAQGVLTGLQMPRDLIATGWGTGAYVYLAATIAKAGADVSAAIVQGSINVLSMYASHERRKQEWELQKAIAGHDKGIASQQETMAEDRVRVVNQEWAIAEMQTDHAEAVVDFLTTKFTNAELYDWMSGVLERVYSFFLQQATSVAQLASDQLAFERHEVPPSFIQADYWEVPSEDGLDGSGDGRAADRRGLTGSARLLQDIYRLDQHAFETNERKLQLTKTISLSRMAPFEFQRFRETGVMTFATPMALFDHDFPGHYLRLIKRVRTSIIALIPPTEGIRATLFSRGTSRVVIGGDVYQTVVVRRDPESVALTSPQNATGLFELEPQSEMSLPFEGLGVDGSWELRMPKAANPFDYRSIADVLFTIEYTALDSFDYRQQVIQRLDRTVSADRSFSFRHQFADQWYDLHNPEQTSAPMVVQFSTNREDFPPNIDGLKIEHVLLYFARSSDQSFTVPVTTYLHFTPRGSTGQIGGGAVSNKDGVISTRSGNAGGWTSMKGKMPAGEWELALPNTEEMKDRFEKEEIEDILLVITYSGRTPEWPA